MLSVETLREVALGNLAEVAEHNITRYMDSVAHFVRFHSGAELHFSYSLSGHLLELRGLNVRMELREGRAVFRM